jgi:hypothetical protein
LFYGCRPALRHRYPARVLRQAGGRFYRRRQRGDAYGRVVTLAQHNLPIELIVMRNNSIALEACEQVAYLGNSQFCCGLSTIELAKVAKA